MYEKELNTVILAVKEAGRKILEIYETDFEVMTKEDESPVTKADLLANDIILTQLSKFNYAFISEESKNNDNRYNSEFVWVIDPIDGTKDFIQKTDDFSIMIGLLKNNEPVLGVVFAPALDKLYYAIKGEGAFLEQNGEKRKLNVSSRDLTQFKMTISRNHFSYEEEEIAKALNVCEYIKMGSTGIKFGYIAEGKGDFYLNRSINLREWDICAPYLILKEAGGDLYDNLGNPLKFNSKSLRMNNGVVCTNAKGKDEIIKILNN